MAGQFVISMPLHHRRMAMNGLPSIDNMGGAWIIGMIALSLSISFLADVLSPLALIPISFIHLARFGFLCTLSLFLSPHLTIAT